MVWNVLSENVHLIDYTFHDPSNRMYVSLERNENIKFNIKKSKPLQIQNHDDLEENDSRDFPSGKKGNESSLSFLNPKRIELSFL